MTIELPTLLWVLGIVGAGLLWMMHDELRSIARDVGRFVDACDRNEREARGE